MPLVRAPTLRLGAVPRVALVSCANCGLSRAARAARGDVVDRGPASGLFVVPPLRFGRICRHMDSAAGVPLVRHPMSTWHNFRAAVAVAEWVTGTARYRVTARVHYARRGRDRRRVGARENKRHEPLDPRRRELETVAFVSGADDLPPGLYGRLHCDKNCPAGLGVSAAPTAFTFCPTSPGKRTKDGRRGGGGDPAPRRPVHRQQPTQGQLRATRWDGRSRRGGCGCASG